VLIIASCGFRSMAQGKYGEQGETPRLGHSGAHERHLALVPAAHSPAPTPCPRLLRCTPCAAAASPEPSGARPCMALAGARQRLRLRMDASLAPDLVGIRRTGGGARAHRRPFLLLLEPWEPCMLWEAADCLAIAPRLCTLQEGINLAVSKARI